MNTIDYPKGVTTPKRLNDTIYFEDKLHWAMNSFAGMGLSVINGDSSGCIYKRYSEFSGLPLCLCPKVAIYRHYWSKKGKISCFLSYPNGMGDIDNFFWEIYSIEGNLFGDVERFSFQEDMEQRVMELL